MKPEKESNLFSPDDAAEPAAKAGAKSGSFSWTASEFIEHQRSAAWYVLLVAATAIIAAGVYFITKDYVAMGIIVILGIIVGFGAGHKPRDMNYELSSYGLKFGEKNYPYGSFRSFSIIREGALNSINFYPIKRFAPPISIFFDVKDENQIVSAIGDRLPHEDRKPDRMDILARRLKL